MGSMIVQSSKEMFMCVFITALRTYSSHGGGDIRCAGFAMIPMLCTGMTTSSTVVHVVAILQFELMLSECWFTT